MKKMNGFLKLNFSKSLKLASLIVFGCSLFSFVLLSPPPPPDLPAGHYTLGGLEEPLSINVEDYEDRIKIINNTGCNFNFKAFVTNNSPYSTVSFPVLNVNSMGVTSISNHHLATVLGVSTGSLTHVSFTIYGASTLFDKDFIPASLFGGPPTSWSTGKPSPCDCVKVSCTSLNPVTLEISPNPGGCL